MDLFKIDGQVFSGVGVESLKRSFRIPDGTNAGDMLSGDYERDIIGTYYDYDLVLSASDLSNSEYDALFEILSAPVNSHTVQMPYGGTLLVFDAMITGGEDELILNNGEENWWGNLTINIRAKKPQRLAT